MTEIVIHLVDRASDDARRCADGVRRFSAALGVLLEVRERVLDAAKGTTNAVCLAPEPDAGGAAGTGTCDLHAVVHVPQGYTDLGSALGALGDELIGVLDRHAASLQGAFSALERSREAGRESSQEAP